jgi:hypothetical protein
MITSLFFLMFLIVISKVFARFSLRHSACLLLCVLRGKMYLCGNCIYLLQNTWQMIVSEIKLFELLKAKIGEKEAEAFVEILESKVDHRFEEAKEVLATKQNLADLEVRLTRTIYTVGVVQYLAILASVIAIIKLLH